MHRPLTSLRLLVAQASTGLLADLSGSANYGSTSSPYCAAAVQGLRYSTAQDNEILPTAFLVPDPDYDEAEFVLEKDLKFYVSGSQHLRSFLVPGTRDSECLDPGSNVFQSGTGLTFPEVIRNPFLRVLSRVMKLLCSELDYKGLTLHVQDFERERFLAIGESNTTAGDELRALLPLDAQKRLADTRNSRDS